MEKILGLLATCQAKAFTTPMELQRLAKISALVLVLGTKVHIKTKPLFQAALQLASGKHGWDRKLRISKEVRSCINFWILELQRGLLQKDLIIHEPQVIP